MLRFNRSFLAPARFVPSSSSAVLLRRATVPIAAAAAAAPFFPFAASHPLQTPSAVLSVARRFSSTTSGTNDGKASADATAERLEISDEDLKIGETMPPLLRYNDHLVAASLALVEYANSASDGTITPELEAKIGAVMQMIFAEEYTPLEEQIAVVRDLMACGDVRKTEQLRDACHAILSALMPEPVLRFVVSIDRDFDAFDAAAVEEADRFVALVVKGGDGNEDDFVAALQSLQTRVPHIDQNTHFIVLLQNINSVLLQARMAALLTEACLAFDEGRTGRIKVSELEESLRNIMPKEAAAKIMAGVEAENAEDGTVSYTQMVRILLRGDGVKFEQQKQ
jgi:hypothetical protein